MEVTGIIKNATVIILTDLNDESGRKGLFLYGTVVSHSIQRFNKGDWFLSSKIIDITGDKIETRNSIYLVKEVLEFVNMTFNEFLFVQQGHEPIIAKKLAAA
jgi:hypothetical protein